MTPQLAPTTSTACPDLVVIGASAGGLEVVREIIAALPPSFPATVAIVFHVAPTGPGLLPAILNRVGHLPVTYAEDGEALRCGRVYVAPANHHLLLEAGRVSLDDGPRENGFRPAIDPLFRSAAVAYGPRAIGVIVSGAMDDGTVGLAAIKDAGGFAVVQNPATALVSSMPRSAVHNVCVDSILDAPAIAGELIRLATEHPAARATPRDATVPAASSMTPEAPRTDKSCADASCADVPSADVPCADGRCAPVSSAVDAVHGTTQPRCPDCGGPMHEIPDAPVLRYRCHEGHGYSAGTLLAKQREQNTLTLRQAVSALREQAALGRRVADRAAGRGEADFASFIIRTVSRLEQRAGGLAEFLRESESDPAIDIS